MADNSDKDRDSESPDRESAGENVGGPGADNPAFYRAELPDALNKERVDRVVSLVADISRNLSASLIEEGLVVLNGTTARKASSRVQSGDVLEVTVPYQDLKVHPDPSVKLSIRHVDDDVIVIDKTPGLIVHPGSGATSGTLIQGLLAEYPEIEGLGSDPSRPGVVHRLDKGTSGLLMVARSEVGMISLSKQLAERTVMRRYQTLVWGDVGAAKGLIDAPLGRSPNDATRQAVVVSGKLARTHYEVISRFEEPSMTLLSCRLETGRTHQIRVHLEAIGNPVVGDDRYGGGSRERLGLKRPFLHAEVLGFEHPSSGTWMEFESELPSDLTQLLSNLDPAN